MNKKKETLVGFEPKTSLASPPRRPLNKKSPKRKKHFSLKEHCGCFG